MKCALAVNHPKTHDRAILQNEMVNVKMVDVNLDIVKVLEELLLFSELY